MWAKGPRTVARPFGYEGTGMNSMIHGFDWKLGQKVGMLASVESAGSGSLISAAFFGWASCQAFLRIDRTYKSEKR